MNENTFMTAVREWELRNMRESHPEGEFDKQGRWYPSEKEKQLCCGEIRSPSARWPYSLLTHCRSVEHVANLYNVNATELNKVVRQRLSARKLEKELNK